MLRLCRPIGPRDGDVHRADRLRVGAAARARDPGEREREVRAGDPTRSLRHRARDLRAHRAVPPNDLFVDPEDARLRAVGVRHRVEKKEVAGAGFAREHVADEAAGARLGDRQRPAARAHGPSDDAGERVVGVWAVDVQAEARPDVDRRAIAEVAGRRVRRAAREHLDLDLGEVRPVADRRPRISRLDTDELLADDALGQAERAQSRLKQVVRRQRADALGHLVLEHALHLGRHAGHEVRDALADADAEPGRRAYGVRENVGARRKVGLLGVRRRQRAPGTLDATADVLERGPSSRTSAHAERGRRRRPWSGRRWWARGRRWRRPRARLSRDARGSSTMRPTSSSMTACWATSNPRAVRSAPSHAAFELTSSPRVSSVPIDRTTHVMGIADDRVGFANPDSRQGGYTQRNPTRGVAGARRRARARAQDAQIGREDRLAQLPPLATTTACGLEGIRRRAPREWPIRRQQRPIRRRCRRGRGCPSGRSRRSGCAPTRVGPVGGVRAWPGAQAPGGSPANRAGVAPGVTRRGIGLRPPTRRRRIHSSSVGKRPAPGDAARAERRGLVARHATGPPARAVFGAGRATGPARPSAPRVTSKASMRKAPDLAWISAAHTRPSASQSDGPRTSAGSRG